jgi:hypothetical protein
MSFDRWKARAYADEKTTDVKLRQNMEVCILRVLS